MLVNTASSNKCLGKLIFTLPEVAVQFHYPCTEYFVSPKSSDGEIHRLFISHERLVLCCAGHGCCPSVLPWSRLAETFSVSPLCISPFFSLFVVAMTLLLKINALQVINLSSTIWRQIFHLDSVRLSKRSSKCYMCWGEGGPLWTSQASGGDVFQGRTLQQWEFLAPIVTHSYLGWMSID